MILFCKAAVEVWFWHFREECYILWICTVTNTVIMVNSCIETLLCMNLSKCFFTHVIVGIFMLQAHHMLQLSFLWCGLPPLTSKKWWKHALSLGLEHRRMCTFESTKLKYSLLSKNVNFSEIDFPARCLPQPIE